MDKRYTCEAMRKPNFVHEKPSWKFIFLSIKNALDARESESRRKLLAIFSGICLLCCESQWLFWHRWSWGRSRGLNEWNLEVLVQFCGQLSWVARLSFPTRDRLSLGINCGSIEAFQNLLTNPSSPSSLLIHTPFLILQRDSLAQRYPPASLSSKKKPHKA